MLFSFITLLFGSNALHMESMDKILDANVMLNTTNVDTNDQYPWCEGTSGVHNEMVCNDFTRCNGETSGWDCCESHGGRAKCPVNLPTMCAKPYSCGGGTAYCCSDNCEEDEGPRYCPSKDIIAHNCNCGTRIEQWASGKGRYTCRQACFNNNNCKSFGLWARDSVGSRRCALFDKACTNTCPDPTATDHGYFNDVYNVRTDIPFASNCNCGTRLQQWSSGKGSLVQCRAACYDNENCKSFGLWTTTSVDSGYCALFDKLCTKTCPDPVATWAGYFNNVYNVRTDLEPTQAPTTEPPTQAPTEPTQAPTTEPPTQAPTTAYRENIHYTYNSLKGKYCGRSEIYSTVKNVLLGPCQLLCDNIPNCTSIQMTCGTTCELLSSCASARFSKCGSSIYRKALAKVAKGGCTDIPDWVDTLGRTCAEYKSSKRCIDGFPLAWDGMVYSDYAYSTYAVNGIDATKACCACGKDKTG